MIKFPCPKCGFVFQAQDSWAGKSAKCNQCGERVVIPDESEPSPLPKIESVPAVSTVRRPTKLGDLPTKKRKRSGGILDVVDVGFEKYLTPWIIRATWITALLLTPLSVLLLTIVSVAVTLRSGSEDMGPRILGNVLSFVSSCVAATVFLLWLRVILETIIVLFNISTTLREMKDQSE